jgi:hypothetical protein
VLHIKVRYQDSNDTNVAAGTITNANTTSNAVAYTSTYADANTSSDNPIAHTFTNSTSNVLHNTKGMLQVRSTLSKGWDL